MIAAARELRDRWLEEVNAGRYLPEANGKYDVARVIEDQRGLNVTPFIDAEARVPALPAPESLAA